MNAQREQWLTDLFRAAADAGYGTADGPSFQAFPGMNDVAADYIEAMVDLVTL